MRLRNYLAAAAISTLALGAVGVPADATTTPDPVKAGTVVAWGDTDNPNEADAIPVPEDLTSPVTSVAANGAATGVVMLDGKIRVWGSATQPEVGEAPDDGQDQVTDATALALTAQHGAVLHADGTVEAWGPGDALSDVPSGLRAKAIALQGNVGWAVRQDGTLTTWGGPSGVAMPTPAPTDLVDISGSLTHLMLLHANGTVTILSGIAPLTDVPDFGGKKVVQIAAGMGFSTVVFEDGTIEVWGLAPPAGGPTFDGDTPAEKVVSIATAATTQQVGAVTADGVVHTWGTPEDVAAVPESLDGQPVSAIALGDNHAAVVVTTYRKVSEAAITGTPEVGRTLGATPMQVSLTPDSSTGQWFADNVAIDGETGTTLTLDDSMLDSSVTYMSTATRGDVTFESTSPAVTVAKASTTTKLTVTPASTTAGQAPVATATVTRTGGTATGTVTFTAGGASRAVPLSGGKASWTLPVQGAGARPVTAVYSGNSSSAASSAAPVTIKVAKATSKLNAKAAAKRKAKKVTLTITVTTAKGVSPAGKVTVTLKGKTKKTVAVKVSAQGKAAVTVKKLKAGKYTATLKYAGNGNVSAATGSAKFKI